MKRTIAVAICGLMVLATLIVCFQSSTAINPANASQAVPSSNGFPHASLPCPIVADPAHRPTLKNNGCGQPVIEASPTEKLTHTPFLPR